MKESISYSFLLNIIIVFVFVCFAIIMGVLSYYRAFRANEAIIESIEKYEGYNCASQSEIQRKLAGIGYGTPFNVTCDGKDQPCTINENKTYAVISYNLDGPVSESYLGDSKITSMASKQTDADGNETNAPITGIYANGDEMNSVASTTNEYRDVSTKHYQYGVYTYMYVDLPIVSSMIRLPFYSKTNVMYEFRDLSVSAENVYDTRLMIEDDNGQKKPLQDISTAITSEYTRSSTGKSDVLKDINSTGYDARERAKYDLDDNGIIDMRDSIIVIGTYKDYYSVYGTCTQTKTFSNY